MEVREEAAVTVSVARKMLKVSRQRIHQLLDSGELVGTKIETLWHVKLRSIERYGKSRKTSTQGRLDI